MDCLSEYSLAELECLIQQWGHLPIHARRLLRRYYDHCGEVDLDSFCLPKALQRRISDSLTFAGSHLSADASAADGTRKLLIDLHDGARIESVLMPDFRPDRAAGCLSTQVGCAMACAFCATGMLGFTRNLSAGEIVEQFLQLRALAKSINRRLSTIVLMGMGEPLLNLENVVKAMSLIAGESTGHLGHRQITLSTIGLLPPLRQFVELRLNVQLAISLHAPDDDLRAQLIPATRPHPIADVLALAAQHQQNTGRTAIIQYCLLDGVNDTDHHAADLAKLLAGRRMHVNLLMYNPTGQPFAAASNQRLDRFLNILRDHRIVAHTRRSRGDEISAACGQLRRMAHTPDPR